MSRLTMSRLTITAGALAAVLGAGAGLAAPAAADPARISFTQIRPEFTRPSGMPGQPRMVAATGAPGELAAQGLAAEPKPIRRKRPRR